MVSQTARARTLIAPRPHPNEEQEMNDNLRPSQRIRWLKEPETPEREHEKQKNREKYERRKHRQGKTTTPRQKRQHKKGGLKTP